MAESKDKHIKRRRRVSGKWAGICATYLASLAGVVPVTARRYLSQFGKARANTCTTADLRRFIFHHAARQLSESIRKDVPDSLINDFLGIVPGLDKRDN